MKEGRTRYRRYYDYGIEVVRMYKNRQRGRARRSEEGAILIYTDQGLTALAQDPCHWTWNDAYFRFSYILLGIFVMDLP